MPPNFGVKLSAGWCPARRPSRLRRRQLQGVTPLGSRRVKPAAAYTKDVGLTGDNARMVLKARWWSGEAPEPFARHLSHGIDDLELLGGSLFTIGVPVHSSRDFRVKLSSAAIASTQGRGSIDYLVKRYGDELAVFAQSTEREKLTAEILGLVKKWVISCLNYIMPIKKPDVPWLFACSAAIYRLQFSFQSAVLLIRNGFHFEALAVERQILEQLAWVYTIHDAGPKFMDVQPQSCIGGLKKFIPYVGTIYGFLSSRAHIVGPATHEYIRAQDGGLHIVSWDDELSLYDAYFLLGLVEVLTFVSERVYAHLLNDLRYLDLMSEGSYAIKPSPLREEMHEVYIRIQQQSNHTEPEIE